MTSIPATKLLNRVRSLWPGQSMTPDKFNQLTQEHPLPEDVAQHLYAIKELLSRLGVLEGHHWIAEANTDSFEDSKLHLNTSYVLVWQGGQLDPERWFWCPKAQQWSNTIRAFQRDLYGVDDATLEAHLVETDISPDLLSSYLVIHGSMPIQQLNAWWESYTHPEASPPVAST